MNVDGHTVSQQETEDMFAKIEGFLSYLRNVIVNNSDLAKQVQELTTQVNELTAQVGSVVGQNAALQEAVNVLTQERDTARRDLQATTEQLGATEKARATAQNDADHWFAEHERLSQDYNKIKEERSALESDHLKLMEEHEKVKAKLASIEAMFRPVVQEVQVHTGDQPRDPATQQWRGWQDQAAS